MRISLLPASETARENAESLKEPHEVMRADVDRKIEPEVRNVARTWLHFDSGPDFERIQAAIIDDLVEVEIACLGVEQRRHDVVRILTEHKVVVQLGQAGAPGVAFSAGAFEHGKINGAAEQFALEIGIEGQRHNLAGLFAVRRRAGPSVPCPNQGLRLSNLGVDLGQTQDKQAQNGSQDSTNVKKWYCH